MKKILVVITVFFAVLSFSLVAMAITIDGSMSDWGVDPSSQYWVPGDSNVHTGSAGNPLKGGVTYNGNKIWYWIEDGNITHNGYSGWVEPGYGGNNYDVKAMYLTFGGTHVYGAVVTGFPQSGRDYGNLHFSPGDLAFDFGADGSYEFGVATRARDSFTTGNLYEVSNPASDWYEVHYSSFNISNPWALQSGNEKGDLGTDYYYYDNLVTGYGSNGAPIYSANLYVIEVQIEKSLFGGSVNWNQPIAMHWTMECGNDGGTVVAPVPEPGTILLLGIGLLGLGLGRKKLKV